VSIHRDAVARPAPLNDTRRTVTTGDTPTFATNLRTALDNLDMPVRELARRLTFHDAPEKDRERERRSLNRYLAGENVPTIAKARRIEDAMGLKHGALLADDTVERPARTVDLLAEIKGLLATMDHTIEQTRAADADRSPEIAVRLESLEAVVDAQGQATTKALRALAADVRRLERRLAQPEPEATRKRAAR
jgi:hypothetical protein